LNCDGQATVPSDAQHNVVAIAARTWHSLALLADGSVVGWDWNLDGQATVPSDAQHHAVAIAAGAYYSLALLANPSPPSPPPSEEAPCKGQLWHDNCCLSCHVG
jgi:hypothetical protein